MNKRFWEVAKVSVIYATGVYNGLDIAGVDKKTAAKIAAGAFVTLEVSLYVIPECISKITSGVCNTHAKIVKKMREKKAE